MVASLEGTLARSSEVNVEPAAPIVARIRAAINAHDLDALVDCFAADYRNDTPAHPARGFEGREQVRRNWTRILEGVPDIHASLIRSAVVGEDIWAEWDWAGTRRDGAAVHLRGVTIQGVDDTTHAEARVAWARFYMEPVDDSPADVEANVERTAASASVARS